MTIIILISFTALLDRETEYLIIVRAGINVIAIFNLSIAAYYFQP